ncbi:MAG: PKD domain-containing protein, partial [bacterium]
MRPALVILSILAIIILGGCSKSGNPVVPGQDIVPVKEQSSVSSHILWGLWNVKADPETQSLEIIPMREGAIHVNTLKLLEPPAGLKLKVSGVTFNGTVCDVDVTLVHPFPGLSQYIGFDVAGIFISKGTLSGFDDPDLIMAGSSDSRLLNPDGWTRWWNPVEFSIPGAPLFRYRDGMLGVKNSTANYNCTLNAYKLFGNEIGKNDEILTIDPSLRLYFKDGATNTRHYKIDFANGMQFNYAVDANWQQPEGDPPFNPEDYAPEANRPEAWAVSVSEIENTLYNNGGGDSGGNLKLEINVMDHFNADLNAIWLDSPGNFDPLYVSGSIGGGDGFSTYEIEITNATPDPDSIDILIGVESEVTDYADLLQDNPVTAYFMYTANVGGSNQYPPIAIMEATTSTDIDICNSVSFDASASTGTPPLTFEWDFNGDGTYDGPEDDYTGDPVTPTHQFKNIGTFEVTVKVSNAYGEDISDPVEVTIGLNPDGIYVDGDYTGGTSDGTPTQPYKTIQAAVAVATNGDKIHVDYMDLGTGIYDTAGLTLKSGVLLLADNWNGCDQGKPKVSCATSGWVFFGTDVSDVVIEGFEIIVPSGPSFNDFVGQPTLASIRLRDSNANGGGGSTNDNSISKCRFTGTVNIAAGFKGIYLEGAIGTTVELCEFKDINGKSSSNFDFVNCVMAYRSDNTTVRKNWVHDVIADASTNSGRLEVFRFLWSDYVEVTNNLVNSCQGQNGYCNLTGLYIDGQPGDAHSNNPIVANNTFDNLQGGGYGFNNVIEFSNTIVGTFAIPGIELFNNIVSNTQGSASSRAYEHVQPDPSDPCTAYFC